MKQRTIPNIDICTLIVQETQQWQDISMLNQIRLLQRKQISSIFFITASRVVKKDVKFVKLIIENRQISTNILNQLLTIRFG
jgi:hypothetical protein